MRLAVFIMELKLHLKKKKRIIEHIYYSILSII